MTKAVAVVGFKDSGKTRVVSGIVEELKNRGFKVGTLKHTAEDIVFDTPGKDTSRHREAGSYATGILHETAGAFFIYKKLNIFEATEKLGPLDYLIIEGFKTLDTIAKIIVPREENDIEKLSDGLGLAIVQNFDDDEVILTNPPSISLHQINSIVDIIEDKAFPILPGLNCRECGYESCHDMGKAILKGEINASKCVKFKKGFSLKVNGLEIPIKKFVRDAFSLMVLGFIKSLKGGEGAKEVEFRFVVEENE